METYTPNQTQGNTVSPATAGFGVAAAVAIILNTLLVWAKEGNPALLQYMKSFGHHWITHGVVIVVLFLALGFLFSKMPFARRMSGRTITTLVLVATILGGLGIFGWFLIEG